MHVCIHTCLFVCEQATDFTFFFLFFETESLTNEEIYNWWLAFKAQDPTIWNPRVCYPIQHFHTLHNKQFISWALSSAWRCWCDGMDVELRQARLHFCSSALNRFLYIYLSLCLFICVACMRVRVTQHRKWGQRTTSWGQCSLPVFMWVPGIKFKSLCLV